MVICWYEKYVDELKSICQVYKDKVNELEGLKWDLEYETLRKEAQVQKINLEKQIKFKTSRIKIILFFPKDPKKN